MKSINAYALIVFTLTILTGCEYDNYDEPKSELKGKIVYQDNPVGLRSNEVEIELWQDGFELKQDIRVYVNQDGTFSSVLFDGEYQLVLREGNGPWVDNTDSITVQLSGVAE